MEPQGKQQIIQQYQAMMDREKEMVQRVAELQAQESEYRLVAETIRPLEGGRKCFQLINGVLVERVVSEVLPIVDQNRDSLTAVVKTASEQLQRAASERAEFQRRHGIQAVPQSMAKQLMQSQQLAGRAAGGGGGGGGGDDEGGAAPATSSRQGILA